MTSVHAVSPNSVPGVPDFRDDRWHTLRVEWDGERRSFCLDGVCEWEQAPRAAKDLREGHYAGVTAQKYWADFCVQFVAQLIF